MAKFKHLAASRSTIGMNGYTFGAHMGQLLPSRWSPVLWVDGDSSNQTATDGQTCIYMITFKHGTTPFQ